MKRVVIFMLCMCLYVQSACAGVPEACICLPDTLAYKYEPQRVRGNVFAYLRGARAAIFEGKMKQLNNRAQILASKNDATGAKRALLQATDLFLMYVREYPRDERIVLNGGFLLVAYANVFEDIFFEVNLSRGADGDALIDKMRGVEAKLFHLTHVMIDESHCVQDDKNAFGVKVMETYMRFLRCCSRYTRTRFVASSAHTERIVAFGVDICRRLRELDQPDRIMMQVPMLQQRMDERFATFAFLLYEQAKVSEALEIGAWCTPVITADAFEKKMHLFEDDFFVRARALRDSIHSRADMQGVTKQLRELYGLLQAYEAEEVRYDFVEAVIIESYIQSLNYVAGFFIKNNNTIEAYYVAWMSAQMLRKYKGHHLLLEQVSLVWNNLRQVMCDLLISRQMGERPFGDEFYGIMQELFDYEYMLVHDHDYLERARAKIRSDFKTSFYSKISFSTTNMGKFIDCAIADGEMEIALEFVKRSYIVLMQQKMFMEKELKKARERERAQKLFFLARDTGYMRARFQKVFGHLVAAEVRGEVSYEVRGQLREWFQSYYAKNADALSESVCSMLAADNKRHLLGKYYLRAA